MSFSREKRENIRTYILEKINDDQENFVSSIAQKCSTSPTTIRRYLKSLEESGAIKRCDRKSGYELVSTVNKIFEFEPQDTQLEEDRIYETTLFPIIRDLPENIQKIWGYAFTEIMNNAIEHADAHVIKVWITQNALDTLVLILDDGVGIFNKLRAYISNKEHQEVSLDDAVSALFIGKLTTNSEKHSGEGIFFSSRVTDDFIIVSSGKVFTHNQYDVSEKWDLGSIDDNISKMAATTVMMRLCNNSKRELREVFDMFSTIDDGFCKTQVPIKNMITSGFPVSRSQARRLCSGFDKFEEVELDFKGIDEIGQAFAHEIFVVYKRNYPSVKFTVKNANKRVSGMIAHVQNSI